MRTTDWIVLCFTLAAIIAYGLYRSKTSKNLEGYFLSDRSMPWYLVLLSIMGTQASAITFLSAPGQAFTDGMRFVQYYFGLPLAMVLICISFVPIFNKLKVFTAYEFLEQRFDLKTRTYTSLLFLISRGLSTGISIYAPSIILSSLLGWDIYWTNIIMGGLLIIYTVSGGAKAVAYTQQLQLIIIFIGMFIAGYIIVHSLPADVGFADALKVSGAAGKLNVITTGVNENGFNWKDRYNIISGVIGGFFLALSYFGTDQSQVGRYLTAKDNKQSKIGLLMNGFVKVPMQFLILLIGALLFTYYQFNPSPIFYNKAVEQRLETGAYKDSLRMIKNEYNTVALAQQSQVYAFVKNDKDENLKRTVQQTNVRMDSLRKAYKTVLTKTDKAADVNDTNYIFLRFVIDKLPVGIVGLLIAIIFLAAWGSIAAALNSLASCSVVDFYCRFEKKHVHPIADDIREAKRYRISKWYTFFWGVFSIIVAQFSNRMGSLIEAVNILGSLFYGVILGIFLVAFYARRIQGNAVFWAAVIGEIAVIILFRLDYTGVIGLGFLWLNVAGAVIVFVLAYLFHFIFPKQKVPLQARGL